MAQRCLSSECAGPRTRTGRRVPWMEGLCPQEPPGTAQQLASGEAQSPAACTQTSRWQGTGPGSALVELPLRVSGEGPAGRHRAAHELFGELFGEGAAGALHSLRCHQQPICNGRLSGQDSALSTG